MERGNIEIRLANGKSLSTQRGDELYWFHRTDGRSIVEPPPPKQKEQPQKPAK